MAMIIAAAELGPSVFASRGAAKRIERREPDNVEVFALIAFGDYDRSLSALSAEYTNASIATADGRMTHRNRITSASAEPLLNGIISGD